MPLEKLEVSTGPWMSREGIKYKMQMEIMFGILNSLAKGGVTVNNKATDKWEHLLKCTA